MSLLLRVLRHTDEARHLTALDWDLLVRQCRHANLLGRLHQRLEAAGVAMPERARNHLLSGTIMAEQQHHSIRREVGHLREALSEIGLPLILLKGAAYVAAGLPAAAGRLFADVDILVPHARLAEVESALMLTGWQSTALDAYDQRYYRRWMHELPAMQHMFRGSALDVHHSILPPTSRLKPDARLLIEASDATFNQVLSSTITVPGVLVLWTSQHAQTRDYRDLVCRLAARHGGRVVVVSVDLQANPGLTPPLVKAILQAPVDLLWNGGIGTYIKASTESNPEVGDKANDSIRVDGNEVRATVVGEGGNLGVTELGRIEFDLATWGDLLKRSRSASSDGTDSDAETCGRRSASRPWVSRSTTSRTVLSASAAASASRKASTMARARKGSSVSFPRVVPCKRLSCWRRASSSVTSTSST